MDNYYENQRLEVFNFIPDSTRRVLDVGCGHGNFGDSFKKLNQNAEVWGVELFEDAAKIAEKKLDKVLIGDILSLISELPDNYFDLISFNDSLEHMVEPEKVIHLIKSKLSENGHIFASIPNVRYFRNLYNLVVRRDWEYEESGILDRTHLRFYTYKSIKRMFPRNGYSIIKFAGVNRSRHWCVPLLNIFSLGLFSDTFYLQFGCLAKPK